MLFLHATAKTQQLKKGYSKIYNVLVVWWGCTHLSDPWVRAIKTTALLGHGNAQGPDILWISVTIQWQLSFVTKKKKRKKK